MAQTRVVVLSLGDKRWSNSEYVLDKESTGFPGGLDMGHEREMQEDSKLGRNT